MNCPPGMSPPTTTKPLHLTFNIPVNVDVASEDSLRLRELLLEALRAYAEGRKLTAQEQADVDALLTES